MSKDKLLNISPVTDSTPLPQVYVVAMQSEEARKKLNKVNTSIFSNVRRQARNVFEEAMARVGNDFEKLDEAAFHAMRAEFKHRMESAETVYEGAEPDKKAKNTWNQNKANLARALGLGFNFIEDPEASSGHITGWCTDRENEIEEAADAAARAEYNKQHGIQEVPAQAEGDNGTSVQVTEQTQGKSILTDGEVPKASDGKTIQFKDDEQKERFMQFMKLMVDVSAINPAEIDGIINGGITQLNAKHTKLLKYFAGGGKKKAA